MAEMTSANPLLPPDDLTRALAFAQADGETVRLPAKSIR
jgi:hypothetical protein